MAARVVAFVLALALFFPVAALCDEAQPAPEPDPAKVPTAPKIAPTTVAVAHIMIAFKASAPADPSKGVPPGLEAVTRTHDEAKALAADVVKQARATGADFAALAKKFSDDKSTFERGGVLGRMERSKLPPPIEAVVFGMEVGQVSDPVESSYGFHVFTRQEEFAAAHLLVMHKGSERVPQEITRTKEEALAFAQELLAKLAGGAKLADLAATSSDCPSKRNGGDLGTFGPGQMVPEFEKALAALKVGELSDIVETKFGYHILQRLEAKVTPYVQMRASHILLMYKGLEAAPPTVTRTKEEALAQIEALLKRIQAGEDFGKLAAENSDCPSKAQGGDLGPFRQGAMVPEFEKAAFALEVGGLSGIVESPFGFHLIRRTE